MDLTHAYQQLLLDDESKVFVTINTHKGLFRYNRLPFRVALAPAIFQRTIDSLLQGISNTCAYLDDILVLGTLEGTAPLHAGHSADAPRECRDMAKEGEYEFLLPQIEYLGHLISAEGLKPTTEKVRAIQNAPAPQDSQQLRSFLGFYSKFLPNLVTLLAPL